MIFVNAFVRCMFIVAFLFNMLIMLMMVEKLII